MNGSGLRTGGAFLLIVGIIVGFVTLDDVGEFDLEVVETITLVMGAVGAWLVAGVIALVGGTIVDAVAAKQGGGDRPPPPPTE